MKKVIFSLLGILILCESHATTKCIQWPTSNGSGRTDEYYKPDWTVTWSNGFKIKGTSMCSNTDGVTQGTVGNPTWSSSDSAENINCWCKMTSPAVSAWVFGYSNSSAVDCAWNCALGCSFRALFYADFRSAMIGSAE